MNWDDLSFDWNQVRAFLATAEEGSLSAAARALKTTQPTISRQVAALELSLGVTLFERGPRTLLLTDAGRDVLAHVRVMAEAASRASIAATGQSQAISGIVSVTATDLVAVRYLPEILSRLRETAPGIQVEVLASSQVQDLTKREADISIRHARPEQPELIGKLVYETSAHFYAAKTLLEREGRPETVEALSRMPFVGFAEFDRVVETLGNFGLSVNKEAIVTTTESGTMLMELVGVGLGVSILPDDLARLDDRLTLVCPELGPVPVPTWLVTHRELHTSRRIRLVFDAISDALLALNDR